MYLQKSWPYPFQGKDWFGRILLDILAFLAIGLGLVLLVLPGLFLFVAFSLTQWQLFAQYGTEIGLNMAGNP